MQKHKKTIAIVLAGFMILSVVLSIVTQIFISASASSALDKAKDDLGVLEDERKEIEKDIKEIEEDQSIAYKEKQTLEKQIENTVHQIRATENVIKELDNDIVVQTKNLEAAEIKMDEQYETYKTRVRVMYEGGETTYLDILLSSGNFVDMLANLEVAKLIMDYDKKVFEDYTEQAKIVENSKIKLEENRSSQETHKQSLSSKKSGLDKDLVKSEQLMKDLANDEESKEKALDAAHDAEMAMGQKIADLARELSQGDYIGGEFTWPLPGHTNITSPFGMRTHPIYNTKRLHKGIDLGAPRGVEIVAANGGRVIVSDYSSSYGNYVMVDHGGGKVTTYAHMSKRSVKAGETVGKGQKVGEVGTTGASTGNHLHFEIIVDGVHKDPMSYYN